MDEAAGEVAIRLARRSIERYLDGDELSEIIAGAGSFGIRRGVFVSLYKYPSKELRGCIGYPYPTENLAEALVRAALAAALEDPRFPPMSPDEIGSVVIEVSLLTRPEVIEAPDKSMLPLLIEVGRDGLIIESRYGSGLLLPQVPVEYGWSSEEFLMNLCLKAGLEPTYWLEKEPVIKRFMADIFAEESPGGPVKRVELRRRGN